MMVVSLLLVRKGADNTLDLRRQPGEKEVADAGLY